MNATYRSKYGLDETITRLREAFTKPTLIERVLPTRVRLAGRIEPPSVLLFRDRGNRSMYLRFEGEVRADGSSAVLDGQFIDAGLLVGLNLFIWFFRAIGVLFIITPLIRWQGMESFMSMLVGVLVSPLSVGLRRFFLSNIKAEREMLEEEIRRVIGEASE